MSHFFFDVTDDGRPNVADAIGTELAREEIPAEAQMLIANIARDRLPDGVHRNFAVTVRDAESRAVYRAALTLRAEWLA